MAKVFKKLLLRCNLTEDEKQDLAGTMAEKTQRMHIIDANAKSAAGPVQGRKRSDTARD